MSQVLIQNLIRQLNELQEGSRWFDQSLKDKLDMLSDKEAFAHPVPQVHSVAEHVSHMLEWRRECLLRFEGKRRDLMNSPDDWKSNDELKAIGWTNLKNLLYDSTRHMITSLENQDDAYLETMFLDTGYNFHYLVDGIIQHDIYHLGQIGITLKLMR
ncbi:MAG: DinB family protein [Sphingobacteriales bacterium]|nr:DinB family protein [Sphingobacteriales bacterium]